MYNIGHDFFKKITIFRRIGLLKEPYKHQRERVESIQKSVRLSLAEFQNNQELFEKLNEHLLETFQKNMNLWRKDKSPIKMMGLKSCF